MSKDGFDTFVRVVQSKARNPQLGEEPRSADLTNDSVAGRLSKDFPSPHRAGKRGLDKCPDFDTHKKLTCH